MCMTCCSIIGQTLVQFHSSLSHGASADYFHVGRLYNLIIQAFLKRPPAVRRRYCSRWLALLRLTTAVYVCHNSTFVTCYSFCLHLQSPAQEMTPNDSVHATDKPLQMSFATVVVVCTSRLGLCSNQPKQTAPIGQTFQSSRLV